jgi:hypothetical protein
LSPASLSLTRGSITPGVSIRYSSGFSLTYNIASIGHDQVYARSEAKCSIEGLKLRHTETIWKEEQCTLMLDTFRVTPGRAPTFATCLSCATQAE